MDMDLAVAVEEVKKTRKHADGRHIKHVYRMINLSPLPIPEMHSLEQIESYIDELVNSGWQLMSVQNLGIVSQFGEHTGMFANMLYVLVK